IVLDIVDESNDHGSQHKYRSEFTKCCIGYRVRTAGIQITDEHADKADKRYPPTGFQANIEAKQSCQAEKGKSKIYPCFRGAAGPGPRPPLPTRFFMANPRTLP